MAELDQLLPPALDELISFGFPDALWIEYVPASTEAGTLYVLDLDYSYTVWRCCLGLSGRWTISPTELFQVQDQRSL